ncbi:MAG: 4-hydroxy-3-methylbut-2-enyl diphosphate reductase [Proteobacteria bacterium]|nr:4-hydroxy-3-methylbut-2-enyl diphosphate reductase [Pseudomonadota bacterium]
MKQVILAKPRGFCAGVERAIEIVERALKKYGAPIYVRHEIVHNRYVVEDLRQKGVVFVDEVSSVPPGSVVIFSAHGVAEQVEKDAAGRNLQSIDATCPLVKKVHTEAQKRESEGRQLILIGHQGHPEVEGTSGRVKQDVILVQNIDDVRKIVVRDPSKLAYVTQTTLSVDDTKNIVQALKERFPEVAGPELKDICYATQNRQDAVKKLVEQIDLLLVIGSYSSSNSNRLKDLGIASGIPTFLVDNPDDLKVHMFMGIDRIGITAGASAPQALLDQMLDKLRELFDINVQEIEGIEEHVKFNLPMDLREVA